MTKRPRVTDVNLEETAVVVADPETGADEGKTETMLPLIVFGETDMAVSLSGRNQVRLGRVSTRMSTVSPTKAL